MTYLEISKLCRKPPNIFLGLVLDIIDNAPPQKKKKSIEVRWFYWKTLHKRNLLRKLIRGTLVTFEQFKKKKKKNKKQILN